MLDEVIHSGQGVAIKLNDLVQLPEVFAESEAPVGLGNHHSGV